jgi:AcrR family transcriptional regulator
MASVRGQAPDGRRLRRARSRETVLVAAVDLASREGIEELTVGRLAELTGISKSGLFAAFGSKEKLQLATVRHAATLFAREVIEPATAAEPHHRLKGMLEAWISYLEREVFPGGCFFMAAATEWDAREGPVREAVADSMARWLSLLTDHVVAAYGWRRTRARQLAFELNAVGLAANLEYQLFRDRTAFRRARIMIERLLPDELPAESTGCSLG